MSSKKSFIAILLCTFGLVSVLSAAQISEKRQKVINTALSLGGKEYVWGSNSEDNGGFDCSGYVQYVFKKAIGMELPRTAEAQLKACKRISPSEREPGDLMFFWDGGKVSHVGIYCGKYTNHKNPNSPFNGKVVFISAISEGSRTGIKIADIEAPYWKKHFLCYARVLPSSKN